MNKMEIINDHSFKIRTFGNLVSNLRKTLDLTQEDFGKLIMISRITAIKVEKIEDVKELSDDLLFRLNHLSFRLMANEKLLKNLEIKFPLVFIIKLYIQIQRINYRLYEIR